MLPLLLAVSLAAVISQTSQAAAQTPTPLCENGTAVPSPAANPGLVADCSALLTAKDTLRGTATLNWDAGTAITAWDGITLAGTPQRVTKLQLTYDRLDGAIPPALGDLEKLEWLYLYGNRLTGTIPAALGSLGELEVLYLQDNQLTGSIPPEFGALSSLGWLGLHNNQLSGPIPVELTTLPALQDLYFENNALTGSIPAGLVDRNLRALYLGGNSGLTGCIPAGLRSVRYKDLDSLSLSYCTTTTTHLLTTTAGTGGRTSPLPGTYRYFDGASVTVTATPDPYYNIGTWGGDCSGTLSTCTLTMDAAKTASVTFEPETQTLTTSAGANGSIDPAPGTHSYAGGTSVTVTATPDSDYRVAAWGDDCSGTTTTCVLTMDADRTASVTFESAIESLTVTVAGEGGSVTPAGMTTQVADAEVTLTASWNDATHSFTGWGGDCSGTLSTCTLTMDAAKTVTATFAALAADRCATVSASDCIRAVYKGAPADYAQVADIPADALLTPDGDGRYTVERGQQVTVVTAAPLPTGYTRFYLQRRPPGAPGTPDPVSFSQLIPPVGTTYTFTVTTDEGGRTLFTFDLTAARTRPFARPGHKPELGDRVVTTTFQVATCENGGAVANPATDTALVADCDALLAMRDALAGTATLNWAAGTPISSWEGVTVAGTPQRVTKLSLANSSLTGELPRGLGGLTALTQLRLNNNQLTGHVPWALTQLTSLTHLYLAANTGLMGCIPPALRTITNNDMASLGLPDCAPLVLTLTAERTQCTEATLNPVTWTIAGGAPPYTLAVAGETVDAGADSANATCGAIPHDGIGLPPTQAPGTIPATVTDATGAPATASAAYTIVAPLPAPSGLGYYAQRTDVSLWWGRVAGAGPVPSFGDCPCPLYLLRWRPTGTTTWTGLVVPDRAFPGRASVQYLLDDIREGTTYELEVAALRDKIEQETRAALRWSVAATFTTVAPATGVLAVATHNTITVTWDPQPAAKYFSIGLRGAGGGVSQSFTPAGSTPHQVVFRHLPPETEYTVRVGVPAAEQTPVTEVTVNTTAPPAGWTPLPRGPQNLRTAVTHNSVTVNWDAPHMGANDVYHVWLHPTSRGRSQRTTVHSGVTTHTFAGLEPAAGYSISVTHADIVVKEVETSVTTTVAPTAAQSTGPVETSCFAPMPIALPEVLICEPARTPVLFHRPLAYNKLWSLTEDIWDWRGSRFHGRRRHDLRSDHGRRQDGQRHL